MGQPLETQTCVFVDPTKRSQTILGIGGALTDASAETFAKLSPAKQRELLDAYYDPDKGIGYSLGRTHIHSCDFSSASYTYVDEGDKALKSFSVEHDRQFRIPFIKQALATAGGAVHALRQPVESTGIHEDEWRHAPRRKAEAGVPAGVGELLHEVHQGVRARGHPHLGHHGSERTDGDADVGVVHLHRRGRARLPQELPRPDDGARRAGRSQDHRLGPQPRSHLPARQHDPRRSGSRPIRVGHRLPLVRAVERREHDVRQRQARPRHLPRQEADLHRGRRRVVQGRRDPQLAAGRALRPVDDQRLQRRRGRLDGLERAARRTGWTEPRRQLLLRTRARRHEDR